MATAKATNPPEPESTGWNSGEMDHLRPGCLEPHGCEPPPDRLAAEGLDGFFRTRLRGFLLNPPADLFWVS